VAELVWYDRYLHVTRGVHELGVGFNVADQDFIEQAGANQKDFEIDGASDSNVAIYEEPGIIDFIEHGDKANAPASDPVQRSVPFKELYNHGPFIDSTDDLDIHFEYSNQSGTSSQYGVQIQLVYAVHEVADGIPQFADPRRLMGD
jgi:hypothetical protein